MFRLGLRSLRDVKALTLIQAIGFSLIVAAVFYPNITSFFHSDDLDEIFFVKTSGPLGIWIHTPSDYFRPLFSIVLWLEWHVWHTNSWGYHADHLFLHGCCAALLYAFGLQIGLQKRVCLAAACFFLVLPGHAEAVAWTADLGGLLATLFSLLCILTYFRARTSGRIWLLAPCMLFLILALLSKEAAVTLPIVLILIEHTRLKKASKRLRNFPYFACAILPLYIVARRAYVGSALGGPTGTTKVLVLHAAVGILRALPVTLSPSAPSAGLYIAFAAISCVLLVWLFRRTPSRARKPLYVLLALFYTTGLPGFWTVFPFSPAVYGYDTRVLYPASVFACLLLAQLVQSAPRSGLIVRVTFLIFALQSFQIFTRWHEAGDWVQQGLTDLATILAKPSGAAGTAPSRLIVLTNPIARFPAYLFLRGIGSGLRLLHDSPPVEVYESEQVTYYGNADRVTITPLSPDAVIVTVNYGEPQLRRTSIWSDASGSTSINLLTLKPPSYRFVLPERRRGDHIVYFSEGRFREWVRAEAPTSP